jgi:aspartyl/asparaginyl-tRNA synthetase
MDVSASGIGEIIGGSQREERLEVLDRESVEAYWRKSWPHACRIKSR